MMRVKSIFACVVIVIALFTGAFSAAGAETAPRQAVVDPLLIQALQAAPGTPVEAIVTFRGNDAPTVSDIELLRTIGISQGAALQSLPMAGVVVTSDQVNALAASSAVRSIFFNKKLEYFNYDSTALTGVDKVRGDAGMSVENGGLPVSGKGVTVVVNDSGVDGTNKDIEFGRHLVQNVSGATNLHALSDLLPVTYSENIPNTDTNSGHGTHVAGTVGGTGAMSNGKYEGVAPGADLVGYGSGAALFILDALGGLDYSLTHQYEYGIRIITNSWGSSGDFDPEDPINIATKKAYDRGIVVTFAAGNEGPGEDTHNPYAKAPWVISVAAGDKQGKLADFSSRGVKGKKGTFMIDGQTWTWEDRPTVTAPGVDIISTRTLAPVSSLAAADDAAAIEPAYLPYYTMMSGTSMATPHVAGIVALMLDANPALSPAEVKQILQLTATNIPGTESWETGAGYVNAYAAVDYAFKAKNYGKTVNLFRRFNSNADITAARTPFMVDYNPATGSSNRFSFSVEAGKTELVVRINAYGIDETTGNPMNLVLISPGGTEYSSGVYVLFPLYTDRTVSVSTPEAGTWTVELRGVRNTAALPEEVKGTVTLKTASGFTGLSDIAGNPAEAAIKTAVSERLADGYADGSFKPNQTLIRKELANYLTMGAEIRQSLPSTASFTDVNAADLPFVEAVTAKGAAFRDRLQQQNGVLLPVSAGKFAPGAAVLRADLAYSLIQSMGLQEQASALSGLDVTVQYGDQRIPIEDAADIPEALRGYVQLALDLNILNAYFTVTQSPYDMAPTVHAVFKPGAKVTRGDFAVAITRFYNAYLAG
ncbi:S8 family serine peptidase [Paenibacillus sp. sptzw28]|uniref:S8 family serine peptidase n=1 Tax=Paenibacillus sp. sptzw28 TaxID=715179 RepID=UPI001C6E8522|nr:S8 family serine peptidase [Paenibacillus sp. sptzw28]QYR22290.1 S8 family serine peptidase [Paenibacillus sp. sptzw28]